MNILIVGATGPVGLGRAVCKLLSQQWQHDSADASNQIKVLVRRQTLDDPDRQDIIKELSSDPAVELVVGDLKDPGSLQRICHGIDAVFTSATTTSVRQSDDSIQTVDRIGQSNLLEAAKQAGVSHYIYTSYSKLTQAYGPCPLTSAKQALESKVIESGMTYTILRPSYFTECWLSPRFGFDIDNKTASFFGDGKAKVSYISTEDVAKFAVAALSNPNGHNAVLELGGPQAIAPLDLVTWCEAAGSGPFDISFVTMAQLQAELQQSDDPLAQSLTALAIALAKGDDIPMDETLKRFPEITLQTVKSYIEQQAGGGEKYPQ